MIYLSLLLFISCKDHSIYHEYSATPTLGWSYIDTLYIEPQISELKSIDLFLEVRHSPSYPYKYLYMVCEENITDSLTTNIDTIAINLVKTDNRIKGSGLGQIYQLKNFYKQINHPQFSSKSKVSFYHLMTDSIIHGIEDIGIRINHADGEHAQHLNEGIQIIK